MISKPGHQLCAGALGHPTRLKLLESAQSLVEIASVSGSVRSEAATGPHGVNLPYMVWEHPRLLDFFLRKVEVLGLALCCRTRSARIVLVDQHSAAIFGCQREVEAVPR